MARMAGMTTSPSQPDSGAADGGELFLLILHPEFVAFTGCHAKTSPRPRTAARAGSPLLKRLFQLPARAADAAGETLSGGREFAPALLCRRTIPCPLRAYRAPAIR